MKKIFLGFLLCFSLLDGSIAQNLITDTVEGKKLEEVVVRGYEQNRKLRETGAAISYISNRKLQSFGNISILPAINTVPGVRMEERSPGSYRLNIRGSSLRSPFGVRNVKIYYNGIPFTDPGGNTYLNQLSYYNFSSIELLKGPAGSLYGAGTGGVMLINSMPSASNTNLSATISKGSFNTDLVNITASSNTENIQNAISYTRQTSDGYREQSAMKREVISWDTRIKASEKQTLSAHVILGDLYYQTPGGLTLTQYNANPRSARPGSPVFPSAVQNKAAIRQKMVWTGINHTYEFNNNLKNTTSVYGAVAQVSNPSIRNYEKRLEPNFGGRTTFSYGRQINSSKLAVVAGAEYQQGFSTIKVYDNRNGNVDSLRTDDEVGSRQLSLFAQAGLSLPKDWDIVTGLSVNTSTVTFNRLSVVPTFVFKSNYNNQVAPRISILKKLSENFTIYTLVSKGFSPPTVSELLPSTSIINTSLQAERGIDYELGLRTNFFSKQLFVDLNAFIFNLNNTISQRRDASGADYFINAGSTSQRGVELALNYYLPLSDKTFFNSGHIWSSYTYNRFKYDDYKQVANDFSGKALPGVAPHTFAMGTNFATRVGLYVNLNSFYSSRIPLNDANSEFADSYLLIGARFGYKKQFSNHISAGLFGYVDNLLNEKYSLGNDINAAAGRYYNAAPLRNYQVGVSFQYSFSK